YETSLLSLALRSLAPEKYGHTGTMFLKGQIDHKHSVSGLVITPNHLHLLDREETAMLERILLKIAQAENPDYIDRPMLDGTAEQLAITDQTETTEETGE